MIRPLTAVKNHVARNRKKYLVVSHVATAAAASLVTHRVMLAHEFFTSPETFDMKYPAAP
jgi:hypothetical protein